MTEENDPAVEQEGASDDATTVTDPQVTEDAAESTGEPGEGSDKVTPQGDKADSEVEIVLAGEDSPPTKEEAPSWVKDVRKENRELKRVLAQRERELAARQQPEQAPDPGPEPKLEHHGFDDEAFKKDWRRWNDATAHKAAADSERAKQQESANASWRQTLGVYETEKAELTKRLPSYVEAEATVAESLNDTQKAIIIHVTQKNSAKVIAALGQRPELLKDLASETDIPIFIAKVARLEDKVQEKKKNPTPPPEDRVTGSGSKSGAVDSKLERLRAQADKTGNRTPVTDYLREKRRSK